MADENSSFNEMLARDTDGTIRVKVFTPQQVAHLNDVVNTAVGRTIGLTVRSVITAETTQYGNALRA